MLNEELPQSTPPAVIPSASPNSTAMSSSTVSTSDKSNKTACLLCGTTAPGKTGARWRTGPSKETLCLQCYNKTHRSCPVCFKMVTIFLFF